MLKFCYLCFIIGILFCPELLFAQDPVPGVEYTVHYGDYGDGVDLAGYVTYDVYLEFDPANPNPALTTIYAAVPDLGPSYIIDVEAECGTFQHDQGGSTVESIQCSILSFFPSLQWDSFFTIGSVCKNAGDGNLLQVTTDQVAIAAWENTVVPGNYFDGGSSMILNNTAIFRLPGDPLTLPDANNRIKIARITSCGGICLTYSIQYFPNYTGPGSQYVTTTQNACFDHPCLANPMDTDPTVGSAGCFGDVTQVTLSDGGFGPVDYSVYSGSTIGSGALQGTYTDQDDGLNVTGLANGNYYITMTDDAGCRDTTAVFTVTEPVQLEISAEMVTGTPCSGDPGGSIQVDCTGGTGQIDILVNNDGPFVCGDLITDLACGNYTISATDENGCEAEETVNIPCVSELTGTLNSTNIQCYGYDDGTITGTISGGVGTISVELILNGNTIDTQSGTGSVNVSFDALDSGDYTVTASDVNDCELNFNLTITEPDEEFSASANTSDASCFSACDGTVAFDIVGGIGPLTTIITGPGGSSANANALCAGNYNWFITDDNECQVSGTFTIGQPNDISYQLNTSAVSCFGDCDGVIDITSVAGGSNSGFVYSLNPNTGNCTPPCSGNSVQFTDLCSANYSVTITDGDGCQKIIPSVNVPTPPQLTIVINPIDVSCFGLNDGEVVVSSVGGTGSVFTDPDGESLPYTETGLLPGIYTYSIADENGCMATDEVNINEPEILSVAITLVTNVGCGGACDGSIAYEVTGGTQPYSYTLMPTGQAGTVNGTVTSLCAGNYDLNVVDDHQCPDSIDFFVDEPDPLFIDISLDSPTCTGMTDGSAVVQIGGGYGELTVVFTPENFEITPENDTTFTLTGIGEGNFVIDLFDDNNCNIQDTVEVVPDIITDMILSLFSSPESCWNEQDGTATVAVQNGNPPYSYLWNDELMQITATATGLPSNYTYNVIVTDVIGCTLSDNVYVEPTEGCFVITTGITPNGDGVNDYWVLGGVEYFPDASIDVFNRWGQVVFHSTGYSSPWDGTFKGEPLPTADYYFVIDYSDEEEPITGTVTIKY